jgi:hypothetical protein
MYRHCIGDTSERARTTDLPTAIGDGRDQCARRHRLLDRAALGAAVPEPATIVLLILAAAGGRLDDAGPHKSSNNSLTREISQQPTDYEAVLISSCNWIVR